MITWSKPQHENGLINEYIIERQASETQSDPLVITQILPSMNLAFVDESTELTPFTTYNYRILARNDAGALASEWATVTTMSASRFFVMFHIKYILKGHCNQLIFVSDLFSLI